MEYFGGCGVGNNSAD